MTKRKQDHSLIIALSIAFVLGAVVLIGPPMMIPMLLLSILWFWLPVAIVYILFKLATKSKRESKEKPKSKKTLQQTAPWQPGQDQANFVQLTVITIFLTCLTIPLLVIPFAWAVLFWIWAPIAGLELLVLKINKFKSDSRLIWRGTVYPAAIAFGIFFFAAVAISFSNPNAPVDGGGAVVLSLFIVGSLMMLGNITSYILNWYGPGVSIFSERHGTGVASHAPIFKPESTASSATEDDTSAQDNKTT